MLYRWAKRLGAKHTGPEKTWDAKRPVTFHLMMEFEHKQEFNIRVCIQFQETRMIFKQLIVL